MLFRFVGICVFALLLLDWLSEFGTWFMVWGLWVLYWFDFGGWVVVGCLLIGLGTAALRFDVFYVWLRRFVVLVCFGVLLTVVGAVGLCGLIVLFSFHFTLSYRLVVFLVGFV